MVRLEKFERKDFKQLIEWISTEELLMNWSGALFSFPLTDKSLDWYINDTNIEGDSDAFVYKVVETAFDKTIGHISIGGISWKNRSARISRVFLTNDVRGKGYCKATVQCALKIGFEELKLHRIGLGLYEENKAALSCYEKSGLKVEGISRDVLWFQNKWWSMIEMSMLENEWKDLKMKTPELLCQTKVPVT